MSLIDKIKNCQYSRAELLQLRKNATRILEKKPEDPEAIEVLETISTTYVPQLQENYLFVAFKPHSKIEDAVDKQWYAGGFYDLQYYEDPVQMGYYYNILCGDILITKTNSTTVRQPGHGKMQLFAHGVVTEIVDSKKNNHRWYKVDWKQPEYFIEVPLIGCTKAIGVRDLALVEEKMPEEFWEWLKLG